MNAARQGPDFFGRLHLFCNGSHVWSPTHGMRQRPCMHGVSFTHGRAARVHVGSVLGIRKTKHAAVTLMFLGLGAE